MTRAALLMCLQLILVWTEHTAQADSAGATAANSSEPVGSGAPPVPVCRAGFRLVNGASCYTMDEKYKNWEQCMQSCEGNGARMSIPTSWQKMDELMKFGLTDEYNQSETPFWVGIHKVKNVWQTIQGVPIDGRAWAADEPDGTGDCTYVAGGFLYDHDCTYYQACVCEQQEQ